MRQDVELILDRQRDMKHFKEGWSNFPSLIRELVSLYNSPRVLEVGGGRWPSLTEPEIHSYGCSYTMNDIDKTELDKAPSWVATIHGDIADPNLLRSNAAQEKFDLIFSHMVFEHVENPENAYKNIAEFLAPGGICVNFIPTLYSPPFLVNRLLPEDVAKRILGVVFPKRDLGSKPKFPAFYRWCTSGPRTRNAITASGFSDVKVVPFYGHDYYQRVPVIQRFEDRWAKIAARWEIRVASTYAFVVCEGR